MNFINKIISIITAIFLGATTTPTGVNLDALQKENKSLIVATSSPSSQSKLNMATKEIAIERPVEKATIKGSLAEKTVVEETTIEKTIIKDISKEKEAAHEEIIKKLTEEIAKLNAELDSIRTKEPAVCRNTSISTTTPPYKEIREVANREGLIVRLYPNSNNELKSFAILSNDGKTPVTDAILKYILYQGSCDETITGVGLCSYEHGKDKEISSNFAKGPDKNGLVIFNAQITYDRFSDPIRYYKFFRILNGKWVELFRFPVVFSPDVSNSNPRTRDSDSGSDKSYEVGTDPSPF